jgi:2-oxoglutarate dehydrogenase E2 component (dihydrolipoamide succinyltransferase)
MLAFLTNVEIDVIIGVVSFLVGLSPLGTKVTDWVKGIPADVRTALNGVEKTTAANIKSSVASAKSHVLASLPVPAVKPAVTAAVTVAAAPAPAAPAPAAPAPAAPAAPAA